MCKILSLTTHKPEQRDEIITSVWEKMSATEKCGFGAAWFTPSGQIGYYRSSQPEIPSTSFPSFVDRFGDANGAKSDGGFLIIHGRTSTCGVSLENTHPIMSGSSAIVHNGVVSSEKHKNECSTCDSELILRAFLSGGVKEVAESIRGYYAFFVLHKHKGKKRLTIAKDSKANLQAGEVDGGFAFATTKELLHIVDASPLGAFKSNTSVEFFSPNRYETESFQPAIFVESDDFKRASELALGVGHSPTPKRWSSYRDFERSLTI